jgi:hypothetical protein
MFNDSDLKQINQKGIEINNIERQIENFRKGFPFANLNRAARPGDGILQLSNDEADHLARYYDQNAGKSSILKFVPASGAASRMFQALFNFIEKSSAATDETKELEKDKGFNSVHNFIHSLRRFAFYPDLQEAFTEKSNDLEIAMSQKSYSRIISYLLTDRGLNYGKLPKGLIKFHQYTDRNRFAFEEHLVEAALYGNLNNEKAFIHFTVSPEHLELFKRAVEKVREYHEKKFRIRFHCSFSVQKPSTDTIAVDPQNNPFREQDGSLLFRPGGHGALIENLNELDADIIFIKNIDNIVPDRLKDLTVKYKKAIGGLLLDLQSSVFACLSELENDTSSTRNDQIADFAKSKLNITIPDEFHNYNPKMKKDFLVHYLNRPMRICGMVKNEGEPGGGPFWVKNTKGEISLQIVESSQIDMKDPGQINILRTATHFNPVDLVCGLLNYKGERFNLLQYIDPETGFISEKSKNGKVLKAQELPGLWNGAMADWITIFVEVPILTFNPVKTVNDLLRPQHQPE